jgi:hypothetical protein
MKCDFCGEKINPTQDYYEIKVILHNVADNREANFDEWIVCDKCFSIISRKEEKIKSIQKRYDELKEKLMRKENSLMKKIQSSLNYSVSLKLWLGFLSF